MNSAYSLDATHVASAAEKMIEEYGDDALTKADDWVKKLQAEDFGSFAKTWELIHKPSKNSNRRTPSTGKHRELSLHYSRANGAVVPGHHLADTAQNTQHYPLS